jgi:hypothetical protein
LSPDHTEEAAIAAYEQAADKRTEDEEQWLFLSSALVDEKRMRMGTLQQSAEQMFGSVAQSELCIAQRGTLRRNLLCHCLSPTEQLRQQFHRNLGSTPLLLIRGTGPRTVSPGLPEEHCKQIHAMNDSIKQWCGRA